MTTKKPSVLDEITGKEAYEMMLLKASNEEKVGRFFYRSDIWRAIRDHIESDECCIIIKENPIICHRGTGQAISIGRCHTYGMQYSGLASGFNKAFPAPVFSMEITITYWNDDYDREYEKTYNIQVPVELLTDFTVDKFNEWIKIKSVEVLNKTRENLVNQIRQLFVNLPESLTTLVLDDLR